MTGSFIDNVLADKAAHQPTTDELTEIATLAIKQTALEEELLAMEDQVKDCKKRLEEVQTRLLPDAMLKAQISTFTTTDGKKISVKDIVRCNISKKNEQAAFQYLREHGAEVLIKNEIKVGFFKGQDAEAKTAIKTLSDMGLYPELKESVPWNTLSSWAIEQIANGVALDAPLLGLYKGKKAIVK